MSDRVTKFEDECMIVAGLARKNLGDSRTFMVAVQALVLIGTDAGVDSATLTEFMQTCTKIARQLVEPGEPPIHPEN